VTIKVHHLAEVDTPAFRKFLTEAAASFHAALKRLQTKPEDVMPWKLNGERWHLGDKGFPVGRKLRWERSVLSRLLQIIREIEPDLQVSWDVRDTINLKVPGVGRSWAYWRTKDPVGLICRFLGKKGRLNLAQVEGLAAAAQLDVKRPDGDVLRLTFQHLDPAKTARLKEILTDHIKGFREAFGKSNK
jgi:excinuclease ABC subunit A